MHFVYMVEWSCCHRSSIAKHSVCDVESRGGIPRSQVTVLMVVNVLKEDFWNRF